MSNLFDIKMVFYTDTGSVNLSAGDTGTGSGSHDRQPDLRSDPGTDQDEEDPGVKTDCQSVYFSNPWNSGTGTVVCNILWNPDDLKSHQPEIWNEL